MAYDENLSKIIHDTLVVLEQDFVEKKMFGGIAFMIDEKMACGIVKDELMIRIMPERYEAALAKPEARDMDFTGRPMKGFLFVSQEGLQTTAEIKEWLRLGIEFAEKTEKKPKKKPKKE